MPLKPAAASPALLALRERTHELHVALEARLALARPAADRADYARYVAAMWGWLSPLEPALWRGKHWPAELEPAERACKSRWLVEDLDAARADGFLPSEPVSCVQQVDFEDAASRFGWAYVIEGSMLGGQLLQRQLGARLTPWPMRYLHGYGERTARRWNDFLAALAREVVTREQIDAAAAAAAQAFRSIHGWFAQRGLA